MPGRTANLVFNGLDGRTGEYLLAPMTPARIARIASGEPLDADAHKELAFRIDQRSAAFGLREGLDATDLADAGWGVIFAEHADPAVRTALGPLLDHRKGQAAARFPRYREFTGSDGYQDGDSKNAFLSRHGYGPGPVDPDLVPYYLLIVGDPDTIPYAFQASLDVTYAVGRIAFETLEEYASYARSVVAAETTGLRLPRSAMFFGTRNAGDGATGLSADQLVAPLATEVEATATDWAIESVVGDGATKARLRELLGGAGAPSLLFTASHGLGYPAGDELQLSHQGALVCQDWPGPGAGGTTFLPEWCFAASDVPEDARLLGSMTFHFACFGAGTPQLDQFSHSATGPRRPTEIAPNPFVAALPRRLLSHPAGGALAVVGHVERAWGSSFLWGDAGPQRLVFHDTLWRIMQGLPVGHALDPFSDRHADLAETLKGMLESIAEGVKPDPYELAMIWTATNDARGYALVGDPAVRLATSVDAGAERSTIPTVSPVSRSRRRAAPGASADKRPRKAAAAATPTADATPAADAAPTAAGADAFALFGRDSRLGQIGDRIAESIREFADRLGQTLTAVVDDAATLNVETWVADDLSGITPTADGFSAPARRRAVTRMRLDGDTFVLVPQTDGVVDTELWRLHAEMVAQAQAGKVELIKAVTSAAGSLLGALKGG